MGALDEPVTLQRHRLTADEYQQMGTAGILPPDARVELIEGEVIDMAPIGTRHWGVVSHLNHLLQPAVGERAIVAVQLSLRLGRHNEPQPDLALMKPRADFYRKALPTPADTLLIIEVSDSTVRYDRQIKLPLYARHGIGELWIVDLEANLLRMYQQPQGDTYVQASEAANPGITAIAALPGVSVDLSGLLA